MRDIPEMNSSNDVDLKQTVNLPRTSFSMKANLPQAEPKMLARWAEQDLYTFCMMVRRTRMAGFTSERHSIRS
jgi:isoleucyl-tRNA synthetase